jgi:hypothetical protein
MNAQQSWIYYWHGLQKFVVFVRGLLTTLFNPKVSVLRGIIDLGALAPLGAV